MAYQTDVQDNGDGTTTYTYSDGSTQTVDSYSGDVISSTGPTDSSSSSSSSSKPTVVSQATLNGNTYNKMSDGTYQVIDEAGNISSSNATDFNNAQAGKQSTSNTPIVAKQYTLNGNTYMQMSDGSYKVADEAGNITDSNATDFNNAATTGTATTPASSTPASTSTSSSADSLSSLISKIASGNVTAKDFANFASSNSGSIAALAGLAALTGGNNVTTGAYQGSIPKLQAIRNQVNAAVSPNQSQQYFTDTQYVNPSDATAVANAKAGSASQAADIIAAAQQQAAARAAAQGPVAGFAMPWVNQTAAGNTPVTSANNAGLPAVIDRSSPGYTSGSSTGASITPGQNVTLTPGSTATDAAAKAQAAYEQQLAQQKAAADAALKAQQDAAAKALADAKAQAAQQLAAANAEKTRLQEQADMGNIVQKYAGKTDPASVNQMQVELAQYMDSKGITTSQLPNIVKGAGYATGWTQDAINKVYQAVDPLAQVVSAYKAGQSPSAVAALAAKNNVTLQSLQNFGLDTATLNDLATKGYLGSGATASPLLTGLLAKDYSSATPADIANINAIAKAQNLTTDQVQKMFPGIDLYQLSQQGINVPGYTAPVQTLTDMYKSNDIAGINKLLTAQGINANDVSSMFKGVDLGTLASQGINIPGYTAPVNNTNTGLGSVSSTANNAADNTGIAAANTANFSNFVNNIVGHGADNTANTASSNTAVDNSTSSAAPAYTNYSYNDFANYVANSGIDLNDPAAVAAAVSTAHADPNAIAADIAQYNAGTSDASSGGGDTTYGAKGGLMDLHYAHGGATPMQPRYLQGTTDGMADEIPSSIDGVEPAKLSHGEFVIPADVVSHLGNGNSDAGAKKLYQMMDKVRMARTGTKKQGKEINPDKFLAGGSAYANGGAVAFNAGGISDIKGYSGTTGSTVSTGTTGTSSGVTTPSIGYSTVNALSPWAGDYVTNMLGSAQALANTPMPVYQGELTAGPSALQNQQFAGLSALANTGAPPVQFQTGTWSNQGAPAMPNVNTPAETSLISQAAQGNTGTFGQPMQLNTGNTGIAGQYMNPYLQQSLQPQLNDLAYQSQIDQQGLFGNLTKQGAFGGSRQAVAQGIGEGNLLAKQADIIGTGYNTAYNQAMGQFNQEQQNALTAQQNQQAANQASANFGLQSLNALGTAGATQQGLQQAADTAAQNQFNQQALYPYQQLQFEQSMLSNLPISTQAVVPNTSTLSNISGALNTSISLADALAQLGIK